MEDETVLTSPGGEYQHHRDWKLTRGNLDKFVFRHKNVDYRIMRWHGHSNFFMNRIGAITRLRDNYDFTELQGRILLLHPGIETVKKYYPEGLQ